MAAQQHLDLVANGGQRRGEMMKAAVWTLDKIALLRVALANEEKSHGNAC